MKYLFFLFLLASFSIFGQNNVDPGQRLLSNEQLQQDVDILVQAIESIHPNKNLFCSELEFEHAEQLIRNNTANGLTEEDFHIEVRRFLRHLSCGHTVARPSKEWYEKVNNHTELLPFTIFINKGKVFINKAFDKEGKLKRGIEVLEIADMNISSIMYDMESIQERDGITDSYVNYRIQRLFRTYYLFLYGHDPVYKLTVLDEHGNTERMTIIPGEYKSPEKKTNAKPLLNIQGESAQFFISSEYPEIGILDINRFSQKKYKKFYKSVFEEIKKRKIDHLVLDLRHNGGGYFPNGNNLLRYFLDTTSYMHFNRPKNDLKKPREARLPFFSKMTNFMFNLMPDKAKENNRRNYAIKIDPINDLLFKGNLYVLTNGGTYSLSSYISTLLKKNDKAVFVGSETGGGEFGSNAVIEYQLTLPQSMVRVNVPYYFMDHKMPRNENFGRGVKPHHELKYTIEDLLEEKDLEMEKIVELVQNKHRE